MTVTDEIRAERQRQIWVVAWLDSLGDRHISQIFDNEERAAKYGARCECFHGGIWQVYQRLDRASQAKGGD